MGVVHFKFALKRIGVRYGPIKADAPIPQHACTSAVWFGLPKLLCFGCLASMETQSLKTTKTNVDTFLKAHVKLTSVVLGEVVEKGISSVDMKSAVGRSECGTCRGRWGAGFLDFSFVVV